MAIQATPYYRGQKYSDYGTVPGPVVPPPVTPPTPTLVTRKNQASMTAQERSRFRDVITTMINSGLYGQHVAHHADMMHRMHSMMGPIGTERFLPWHRVYLDRLEEAMRVIDPLVFIPFWKWTVDQAIPAWLNDFRPNVPMPGGTTINVTRSPGTGTPSLPTEASIAAIMTEGAYTPFTRRLEGSPFGAHNMVHVWVGGTMGDIPTAPADPLFWMHHAEVDRLWHVWQQDHPNQDPNLSGADAVLDPWPERAEEVLDIEDVGYVYA